MFRPLTFSVITGLLLLWIMLQWIWMYTYLFEILLWILFDIYSEVGLLDYMVSLYLFSFWRMILFSIMAAPFYLPTSSAQRFQAAHIFCQHLFCCSVLLKSAILMNVRWFLVVILICMSLMISNVDHLLYAC